MEIVTKQLANALNGQWVYAENRDGTHHAQIRDADNVARELWEKLAALREPHPKCTDAGCAYCNPEPVVDAHICCDHAPGDAELAAMAALLPALPLVAKLGYDARERVMDWAKHRACDGQAPF